MTEVQALAKTNEKTKAEIDALIEVQMRRVTDLRDQENAITAQRKPISEALELEENKLLDILQELGLKSYRTSLGLVTVSYRSSVKLPQSTEDWDKLLKYVRDMDRAHLIRLSSSDLNSMYKADLADAIDSGNAAFQIPGVSEVTMKPILSLRR